MKKLLITLPILLIIIIIAYLNFNNNEEPEAVATQTEEKNINTKQEEVMLKSETLKKPELTIDKNKTYTALLKTSAGDITIILHADKTPITANNFIYLANNNFYDNTIFHRAIDGFMIQGGDPEGTGMGGPGYKFDDEPFTGKYDRGIVAMANSGPNTNGSQFFIMHADYALPANYIIFGEVTDGIEVVDKIATAEVGMSASGEPSKPVNPVTIESVEITETD